jgi:hydroxylamine reductase
MGIKNIYIGPKAPEFLAPGVVDVLVNTFNLNLISGNAKDDLEKMMK